MRKLIFSISGLICITLCFELQIRAQEQVQTESSQTSGQVNEVQDQQPAQSQNTQQAASYTPRPKPYPEGLSIPDQFTYVVEKSSNFQDYKVIKQNWMSKLRENTLDTLFSVRNELELSRISETEKCRIIDSLRSDLNSVQMELKEKNSFGLLGIMVSKTAYDSIMWTIIAGLLVALGLMFAAFKRSYAVTNQTRREINEVKEEYEEFRKKALKSKEEAVRQLYDELNKYKNRK